MILIPKYKTVDWGNNRGPTAGHIKQYYAGEVRAVKYNCMGQLNYDSGWHPNLILNQGLDYFLADATGNSGIPVNFSRMALGDSAAGPSFTQTGLQGTNLGWSGDNNGSGSVTANLGSPSYEAYSISNRRFDQGTATGTIREMVWYNYTRNATTGAAVRAVFPQAIVKASDEVLDVFYRFWRWPDVTTHTGTVTLEGLVYDWEWRPDGCQYIGATGLGHPNLIFATTYGAYNDPVTWGAAGLESTGVTGWTNRDYWGTTGDYWASYSYGTHYRDRIVDVGLNSMNVANGIRMMHMPYNYSGPGSQIRFVRQGGGGEAIPKDNTRVMEGITWRISVARSDLKARPPSFDLTGVDATLTEVIP